MSLQSGNPRGMSPHCTAGYSDMDTDSIKKETEDPALGTADSTSKSSNRKKVGVAPVGVQDYAEKFDIASPRGTDSRKSSRSS